MKWLFYTAILRISLTLTCQRFKHERCILRKWYYGYNLLAKQTGEIYISQLTGENSLCYQIKLLAILIRHCRNCINNFTPLVRYLTEYCTHRLNVEKSERLLRISQSICILLRSSVYWTHCRWFYPLAGPAHASVYVIWPEPHGRPRGSRRSPNPPHKYCISSPWIWEICHTPFDQSVCLTFLSLFSTYSARRKICHNEKIVSRWIFYTQFR